MKLLQTETIVRREIIIDGKRYRVARTIIRRAIGTITDIVQVDRWNGARWQPIPAGATATRITTQLENYLRDNPPDPNCHISF